ncbi:MAG: 2-octaprenyl-6-methoxyphenyl hydroxylase [Azospirillum sp.]|nr:2-octaprenyl-6-methoxyphenyl hydroxylase [Azospirillum sp.]
MAETGGDSGTELRTEVVVVGGGLAGLSLTCALGSAGVPVICIDRDSPALQSGSDFDIRTTAIAYGSRQILAGAGVWPYLDAEAGPILEIRVADNHAPLFVHYDHRDLGDHPLGWIVDNRVIRAGVFRRMAELPSVTHLAPATVKRVDRSASGATVVLGDDRVIRARLVVGADGRGSLCRRSAGIGVISWAYRQTAIACTIQHEWPHRGVAIERFLPAGPFAVLPMTGNRASIVWSERAALAPMYLALPEAEFVEELRRRIGDHLGQIRVLGGRSAYPLSILFAERQTDTRLALVGESAHAIHPIAGQGLNMGLRDVAALSEVVVDQFRLGLDVGGPEVLERFQRWRRFDNMLLAAVCDSLVHLFSNDITPVRLARDFGLGVVNQLPVLKKFFMRHAMGVVGDLPRLTRGERL